MATIEKRRLSSGNTRYWVKWRLGGTRTGAPQSEPFDTQAAAHTFKLHVEAAHHEWPDNWIPRQGWAPGWVPGVGWTRLASEEAPEPVRFADYATDLINSLSGIEERTRFEYLRDLRLHLIPAFGDADLRDTTDLTPKRVREWVNALQAGIPDPRTPVNPRTGAGKKGAKRGGRIGWLRPPLRPKTIQNLHGLLFIICQAATQEDPPLRPSNPAANTRLPRLDDGEGADDMCFLTRDEFRLLRDAAHPDVRDMLEVFVLTGLRYSELTALQVRDITIRTAPTTTGGRTAVGVLEVRRAWKRQPDNTFKLGPPKTKQSRRRITLTPRTIALLQQRISGKGPEEFVFTTERGAWWRHSSFYNRRWVKAVQRAQALGLTKKPRIHDLRHTHVSWLIEENVHAFKIQRRLGHKSITTTMDRYGHLVTDLDDDLLSAIDGIPVPPATDALPANATTQQLAAVS
ncbi:site-specific integrase [Streptomonospora sp. S1-112]|uniref:Site-specific integrase n=1 Tax=Streptomonospora mangrovi TaxID=2883123 RepID=A0A9X3NJ68_9ACTN|nr:site-specific integrase [Streptomonospora mangrovi]MDA0564844.1 site-specific integrase [Streptomonospora mangrovi]